MPDPPDPPKRSLLAVLAMLEPLEDDIGCPETPLIAEDVLPIIARLPREERKKLRELLDAQQYVDIPVKPDEFGTDEKLLELDADGWEEG
jgi:hypothetical protein